MQQQSYEQNHSCHMKDLRSPGIGMHQGNSNACSLLSLTESMCEVQVDT